MNITIMIGGLSGGGAERVVCNLSNYLSQRHIVTILTMSEDRPAYFLEKQIKRVNLHLKNESSNAVLKNLRRLKRFRKYLKEGNIDVFIVMLPGTINFMLAHRHLIKVPIIVSERGDPSITYNRSFIQRLFVKKLYPKVDNFVFQTVDAQKFYGNYVKKKGIIIPNAINEEFIRPTFLGNRRKAIVSVGRLNSQKNFSLLIEAFNKVSLEFPEYTLEIYGDGPQRIELEKKIEKLGLTEKVILPGYVSNISDYIEDASLYVMSSNYEGMPNSLMEAMVLGIPSISTDCPVGGPKFLIENGVNGFLVPINDSKVMAKRIRELLLNPELARKFSERSPKIKDKLSSQKIYGMWEETIINTTKS